jgi:hypothetical protein
MAGRNYFRTIPIFTNGLGYHYASRNHFMRVANLAWDETQSQWLTSPDIGFTRLPSEGSIYIKRRNQDFIAVLNAVDDQLYFATDSSLKKWFEEATQERFDVQFMGQAVWYLQSRITQCTDYSIILDQSRYAALVLQKYLNGTSDTAVTAQMRTKYATPTPTTAVFTKKDCSTTYTDVLNIQAEFGFEYAAAVGSLIYLMNTYIRLNYTIRKLARFMQLLQVTSTPTETSTVLQTTRWYQILL